jgi:hypothetical protein
VVEEELWVHLELVSGLSEVPDWFLISIFIGTGRSPLMARRINGKMTRSPARLIRFDVSFHLFFLPSQKSTNNNN